MVALFYLPKHLSKTLKCYVILAPSQQLGGVIKQEDDHHAQHQHRVKDVEEHLVGQQRSLVALRVLDQAEDGTHKDQAAHEVQHVDDVLPANLSAPLRLPPQIHAGLHEASVENDRDDHEQAKEQDLYDETDENDRLARAGGLGIRQHAASKDLDQEGRHVAADKYLREPSRRYGGD
ncbi:unnamed protein product [Parascedosporium putredinis]|uniref:Uncharacterized protein n=1 Tax=Parascedosporium putredinis TaxID=1442378 RepID=A0A9P1H606_9PEZI|nr:unnamed protein product [Parascedosporium putredinis]CAI7996937.1 unnamed protein product [Parascedosporium putredinis]